MAFRIRRMYDGSLPVNKDALGQIREILAVQFRELSQKEIDKILDQFLNPERYTYSSILFVADDLKGKVEGFALMLHFKDLNFCLLDFLASAKSLTSRGIGGVLYERVRKEAVHLGVMGLFFECLPDDPRLVKNPDVLKENIARFRFYERYGVRPLLNTFHQAPSPNERDNPPYVMFDSLGRDISLSRDAVRKVIKAVLERKYAEICTLEYNKRVLASFVDDPVKLRPPRYSGERARIPVTGDIPYDEKVILVVHDMHAIHHIKEKGYVESPVRIATIVKELDKTPFFFRVPVRVFGTEHITAVHDKKFVEYFRRASLTLKPAQSIYPYVFPLRNQAVPPRDLPDRAGYYCIDSFTPITRNAYVAAKRAVDCALTAADYVAKGQRLAYALVRPPGHHAEPGAFGGFCYFNSAAIAADYLSKLGKVAMLDLDHHHGNGQERIFYSRSDVLTVSIHVHPKYNYPFFSGFRDDRGEGKGRGYNVNIPLPEKDVDGRRYHRILATALRRIQEFKPRFLVVPLGLDISKRDPTGTWNLVSRDFETNGRMIGALGLPTLVVQEGGYNNRVLGVNARCFFEGLWHAAHRSDS